MRGDGEVWERERRKGREGRGGLQPLKLQFLAPPLNERRQSTRFTPDLDPPFRKSWIRRLSGNESSIM